MNEIKKIVIRICFSLLIPIVFLVGTCHVGWANNEASYQLKSNVGITFTEESGENNNDDNHVDTDDKFDTSNKQTNRKKGMLPSTGEQQTIIFSIVGIGLCIGIWVYKGKKNNK
ncbi:TPA: LPXTG cell wall anchor domain-containing protein [Enterococcus faecalis]|nr:LPXTG cell wall anchor domain-containing protein [Enterococcus faecalis]